MPRTMRVEYPGAIYHVMDRGDPFCSCSFKNMSRNDAYEIQVFLVAPCVLR